MMKNDLTPSQTQRQGVQLVVSSKLQQAISLLQLSTVDLHAFIQKEMLDNPFLEKIEVDDQPPYNLDAPTPLYWQTNFSSMEEQFDGLQNFKDDRKNLYNELYLQISLRFPDILDQAIAKELMRHLNEDGFLDPDWQTFFDFESFRYQVSWTQIYEVLGKLRTFEPVGIFAESLEDCLMMQIKNDPSYHEQSWSVYDLPHLFKAFYALKSTPFEKVCKHFSLHIEKFQGFLRYLKKLNFSPMRLLENHAYTQTRIPDLQFYQTIDQDIAVILKPHAATNISINHHYFHDLKKSIRRAKDLAYIKEKLASANWLLNSLEKRTTSLLQVASEIAHWQKDFFLHGREMRPMTLKDIAKCTNLHESTVSRVTSEKYVETPRGIFELKDFFAHTIGGGSEEETSNIAVQNALRLLIAEEPKHRPLSDEDLVKLLASKGFVIARRTVAKYRTLLGINPSGARKRCYQIKKI